MTTCFSTRTDGFFIFPLSFWREKKGKKLLPFHCSSVALPVMCDPLFIWFHLFMFITVTHYDLLELPSRTVRYLFEMTWKNATVIISKSAYVVILTLDTKTYLRVTQNNCLLIEIVFCRHCFISLCIALNGNHSLKVYVAFCVYVWCEHKWFDQIYCFSVIWFSLTIKNRALPSNCMTLWLTV